MKRFLTKDGRLFYCKLIDAKTELGGPCKKIVAYDWNTNEQIGFAQFDFVDAEAYLEKIWVTNKNYLNCGVGTIMLKGMEAYLKKNGVNQISLLYAPFGEGKIFTPFFYKKNGFIRDRFLMRKKVLIPSLSTEKNSFKLK